MIHQMLPLHILARERLNKYETKQRLKRDGFSDANLAILGPPPLPPPQEDVLFSGPHPLADYSIYTDGSKTNNSTGAAAICLDSNSLIIEDKTVLVPLPAHFSSFLAEVWAFLAGLDIIATLPKGASINLSSDSSSIIHCIKKLNLKSDVSRCLNSRLNEVNLTHKITLSWVKGHSINPGNNLADEWANKARLCFGPHPDHPPSLKQLETTIS